MRFYLVRHGETVWNSQKRMQGRQDSPLTALGEEQARGAAQALRTVPFRAAFVSPAGRARRTMEIILSARGDQPAPALHAQVDEDLAEMALGTWEGARYAGEGSDLDKHRDHFWQRPDLYQPHLVNGGESFAQVRDRVLGALTRIAATLRHPAGAADPVLVVAHTVAIRSVLNHFTQTPLCDFWKGPLMPPCCISVLDWESRDRATVFSYAGDESFAAR